MPIQFSSFTSDILRKHIGKSAISPTLVGVLWLHWQWISRHHLGISSRVFRFFVRGSKYCWRRRPGDCNKIEENVPQFALSSARRSRDLKDQASRRIRDTRAHVSSTQQQAQEYKVVQRVVLVYSPLQEYSIHSAGKIIHGRWRVWADECNLT